MKKLTLIIFSFVIACVASSAGAGEVREKESSAESYISIQIIGIEPDNKTFTDAPCEMIIIDPQGRKTGFDPVRKKIYREIPQADYGGESIADAESGEPGEASLNFQLADPPEGEYKLEIFGITSGIYRIEMHSFVLGIYSSNDEFKSMKINKGEVHRYKFKFEKKPGYQLKLLNEDAGTAK